MTESLAMCSRIFYAMNSSDSIVFILTRFFMVQTDQFDAYIELSVNHLSFCHLEIRIATADSCLDGLVGMMLTWNLRDSGSIPC